MLGGGVEEVGVINVDGSCRLNYQCLNACPPPKRPNDRIALRWIRAAALTANNKQG